MKPYSFKEVVENMKPWENPEKAKAFLEFMETREDRDAADICPRCGKPRMDAIKVRNALSRYARVYICNDCGADEALRDLYGEALPLNRWSMVKQAREAKP